MCFPTEDSSIKAMILGEGPGAEEDEQGKQFVGKTGKYLRNYIPRNWINKVYWDNVVRCRPVEGRSNRTPTAREVSCCSTYLKQDILTLRPHAVLAIGGEALNFFWPDAPVISKIRGIPFPAITDDHVYWVMSTFHPSFVMRAEREDYSDGSTVNTALPVFKNDIKNFFNLLPTQFISPPVITVPPQHVEYPKSKQEAMNLFARLKQPYAIDFETFKLKPYHRDSRLLTCGCSDGELTYAFPVNWPGDLDPWGKEVLTEMMLSGKEWLAQHSGMELVWIWFTTGIHKHTFHDTEVLARLLHKRSGLGSLDVLSRIYFGLDVKQLTNNKLAGQGLGPLDKERMAEYSQQQVLEYNALDSWAEILLFNQMIKMLPADQFDNYVRIITTIKSLTAMEIHGLHVDLVESEKLQKELFAKSQAVEKQALQLPEVRDYEKKESKMFSLSAPQDVGYVLDKYCHVEIPKSDKHNYITKAEVLEEVAKEFNHPLLSLTLDYREIEKQKSTYVDPILSGKCTGADGLIHSTYTAVRTRTYRTSSEDPNLQNFPKRKHRETRRQVIPAPGHIFAAFDYAQLEGRVIGMFSKDPVLKQAFIDEDDIHWKWLYRIIDLYPAYMDRLKTQTGETEEKKILKGGRTVIKTDFVFATFYGSQPKGIAYRTGIPRDICESLYTEFWGTYKLTKVWVDNQFKTYERLGEVKSLTGRARNEILPGNEPTNGPVQGSAAEIVIEAQNHLCDYALENDIKFLPRILIHDDLVFELPNDDASLERYIPEIGNEVVKPRFPFITIPLATEARIGCNWADEIVVAKYSGAYFN